jgi:hypothetical protein
MITDFCARHPGRQQRIIYQENTSAVAYSSASAGFSLKPLIALIRRR